MPKRRGRPRKDPNQPKKPKPPPAPILEDNVKPKRNIRAPERYATDYTQEAIKFEAEGSDGEQGASPFDGVESIGSESVQTQSQGPQVKDTSATNKVGTLNT
jgi:hypothetical protein